MRSWSSSSCASSPPRDGARGGASRTRGTRSSPDRKSTRLNSSHGYISYAVFCLKKKKPHREKQQISISHNAPKAPRTPATLHLRLTHVMREVPYLYFRCDCEPSS